ncbi:MAG: hypothetical protein H5T71_00405, partial [Chloroflexi bacterium]|nr:hypothetical protein [Chloroflexota bacterium]
MPVFVAHEAELSDGRRVTFGPDELAAIVENCNRRIEETGDYAVITLGHTPAPGEDKPQPEVVGFAGPFRLGEFAGKPAILADFHIFQEYKDVLKRYPRRSPEFRLVDDLRKTHLDPIALLGAEPPRLDMGLTLLYSEREGNVLVERYAAVMPAGSNTFVSTVPSQDKERYTMDQDLLKQIIEAFNELDWVKWVKKKMAQEQAQGGGETEGDNPQQQYEDQPSDKIDPEKAKQILEDGTVHGKPLTEDQRKMFGAAASRERDADRELRERYRLLEQHLERQRTELEKLRRDVEAERAARVNAERYSQLVQLRQVYAFDLEKEVERCRYSRMTDEQFKDHLAIIRENYKQIPVGERLPPLGAAVELDESREKYSEEVLRRALEIAKRKKELG